MENNNTQTPPPIPPAPIKFYPQPKKKPISIRMQVILVILAGIAATLVYIALPLGLSSSLSNSRAEARQRISEIYIEHLGSCIKEYQDEHDGKLPPCMETLCDKGYILNLNMISSPLSSKPKMVDGKITGLPYKVFFDNPETPTQANEIIRAYEKLEFAHDNKTVVLYADGSTGLLEIEKLNSLLKTQGHPTIPSAPENSNGK